MAIQDDFTIDYVDRKITYTTAFVDDRPPNIFTVNELYSFLQDEFDEPAQMDDPVPMSAQTPTQYTLINKWFIDDESMKALYGGSIQTTGWTKSGSEGITQVRWQDAPTTAPDAGDIGEEWTGGTSTATGEVLAIDLVRQVAWLRNTSSAQFQDNEEITGAGSDPQFQTEVVNGFQSGESIWANLFSVGSLQAQTEIYVGQEDDFQGGRAYHGADAEAQLRRRIEKIDEWWDADVDFFTGSPNLLGGLGHFDILVKSTEADAAIDSGRLFAGARQFSKIYSHFELVGAASNLVVPFASTGADINSAEGPYNALFDGKTGNDLEVGDVLENTTGPGSNSPEFRLRAVVTAVVDGDMAAGNFDYYLIGENEPLTTTDRTLLQFATNDDILVRGDTTDFDINGAPTEVSNGPAQAQGTTYTFANAQVDVDEDSTDEEYALTIDCNSVALLDVYQHSQFLSSRGNQDGSTPDTQDDLLPTAVVGTDEAGEFYRAVGDLTVPWDGKTGTPPAEGVLVTNANAAWTASGVVVALSNPAGASGQLTLTQVKGTWANDETVAVVGQHGANEVTINGDPNDATNTLVDNTAAPFGTFAGGRWFVARGVVLANVPAADANNWETVDLAGVRRAPPAVRIITFAGLLVDFRASIFEVDTAGGIDVTKTQNGVGAAGAAVGDSIIPLDSNVALDVPAVNSWIRVVDASSTTGEEYRFFFVTVAALTVTLDSGANTSGTTTSGGTATVLNDTGAFTNFGSVASVRTGMEIQNIPDGSRAIVLRKIDNNSIETTPLTGGGSNDWANAEAWEANRVVVTLVDADTAYFPFIDDVSSGSPLTASIKFVGTTELLARARFSSPAVGGQRREPFEQLNFQLTDADLLVTANLVSDTIASV